MHAPDLSVPGLGWNTLTAAYESAPAPRETQDVDAEVAGGGAVLDNGLLRVEVGGDGTLHGVYDREAGREVLAGRANQLWAYTDKPRNWEAWDVDEGYEQEGEEISSVQSVEVTESGPLRASVRVVRRWRDSTIAQTYRLLSGSRRLDMESYVDWRERRVLPQDALPARRPLPRDNQRDDVRGPAAADASQHALGRYPFRGFGPPLLCSLRARLRRRAPQRRQVRPQREGERSRHQSSCAARSTPTRSPTRASTALPTPSSPTRATGPRRGVAREAFALNAPLFPVMAQKDYSAAGILSRRG